MSFLDRIRAANTYDLGSFLPFSVSGTRVGCVKKSFAETLTRWPEVFRVDEHRVSLAEQLDSQDVPAKERTQAVAEVLQDLCRQGRIEG